MALPKDHAIVVTAAAESLEALRELQSIIIQGPTEHNLAARGRISLALRRAASRLAPDPKEELILQLHSQIAELKSQLALPSETE